MAHWCNFCEVEHSSASCFHPANMTGANLPDNIPTVTSPITEYNGYWESLSNLPDPRPPPLTDDEIRQLREILNERLRGYCVTVKEIKL
jgi:hypothetical protein